MKKILICLLTFLSAFSLNAQYQTSRFTTGKVVHTQTGASATTFTVSCNFTDEGGLFDGTNVTIGDMLFVSDGGVGYFLPIDSILTSGPSTVIIRVEKSGVSLGAVPTGIGYISHCSENYQFSPFVSGITDADQQISSENTIHRLDSLLKYKLPERISGSSPPAYTPASTDAWIAQSNGTGKLYYFTGTDWQEVGLDTLDGIYGRSDTISDPYRRIWADSILEFNIINSGGYFFINTGDFGGGRLLVKDDQSKLYFYNALSGTSTVTVNEDGILLYPNSNGTDDIKIQGLTRLNSVLTPAVLNANANNYNPTGFPSCNVLRLSSSSGVNVTGFSNGRNGRVIVVQNVGSYTIGFPKQNGASSAANRFASDSYNLDPGNVSLAVYDSIASRWRMFGSGGGITIDSFFIYNDSLFLTTSTDTFSVDLSLTVVGDDWGSQVVERDSSLSGNGTLSSPLGIKNYSTASNGDVPSKTTGGITWVTPLLTEVDGDTLNEIQTLSLDSSIVGNTERFHLSISDGNSVYFDINQQGVLIVDTVANYDSLRIYNGDATLVFVKNQPIEGFFKLTSGIVDDGGINISGTKDWVRVAEDLGNVNVKWFGAVGDSTTNDNTAIQAALDYCLNNPGTALFFPAGKYSYTSAIYAYKPIDFSIKGDGMSNTYLFPFSCKGIDIRTDSTTFLIDSKYGPLEARDFEIKNLSVFATGTPITRPIGIDIGGGYNIKLENVRIEEFFNASGYGVGLRLYNPIPGDSDAVQHTVLDNVYITECDTGITTRLHNTMLWHAVEIDQCNKVGVVLRNGVYWTKGMVQGSQNCGIWIDENPFLIKGIHLERIHFEGNAYTAPKYGTIYKPSSTNTTEISVKDCYLSSPGASKLFNLNRVLGGEFMHNTYAGGTTDTISLTSVKNVNWGRDNYTALKLVTTDCNITWFGGTSVSEESLSGITINGNTPNINGASIGGGAVIGSTYVTSATAPTDGMAVQGSVAIGTTTAAQTLTVSGTARITGSTGTATTISGRNASGDVSAISAGTGISLSSNVLSVIGGISPDSSWAKASGGYANKRITDALYRSSSIRINMAADSAAITIKAHSTFDNPIFKVETNSGSTAFILHYYNSSNPSLVLGGLPTISSSSANNTVFGLTNPTFTAGAGQNTFVGKSAGNACNGCYENTLIGSSAGPSIIAGFQNTFIGYSAGNATTSGYQNMFLGRRAGLTNISGQNNVYVGSDAGRLSTGSGNVFMGGQAGDQNTGSTSTMIGYGAGRTNTGSNNIFLGSRAGETTTGSNRLMIDNSNTSTPLIGGDLSNNYIGINTHIDSLSRTLMVGGTARITSSVGTATTLMGRNVNGDISSPTLNGLAFSGGTLTANSIYTANGSTFSGGPNVTVNGNTIRLYASTFNANPIMKKRLLSGSLGYFDRWIANNDSLEISYITDGFFLNTVGGNFGIISTEQMNLQADSILISTLETVPALKYAIGINSSGILKKIVGSTDGDVLGWDGTSNHWEVRPKTDYTSGGAADGNGIYSGDGNMPNGGSEVTMDTIGESLRLTMNTGNTSTREMLIMKTIENAFTRFIVAKGPTDSLRLFRANTGREYTLQTYGGTALTIACDSIVKLVGDSLLVTEDICPISDKTRFLVGLTDQYYAKRLDANSYPSGYALISNGTDWVPTDVSTFAAADGNGIYGGSNTVPDNTVATVASGGDFKFAYNGGNPAFSIDDALNQTYISGKSGTYSAYADNSNVGLVAGTGTWLVGSNYALTATAGVSNTNTAADRLVIKTNSTGTPSTSFGGSILFQGESSTTDNRDMVGLSAIWTTATDASRSSALVYKDVSSAGALTERFRFTPSSMTTATSFTIGNSSSSLTLGGSSGTVVINSSAASAGAVTIQTTGNNSSGTTFGNTGFSLTTLSKKIIDISNSYTAASGTGVMTSLSITSGYNLTGTASGNQIGIDLNPTLTSLTSATYTGINIPYSNSAARGIYQTGSSTTNNFVGATGFGSTTTPTDKLEVTGNIALLSAGNKIKIATGSNASVGTSGAMTSGTITINTTAVTANSIIFLTHANSSGTLGELSVGTITAGTSFVINSSSSSDTSTVNWIIIN